MCVAMMPPEKGGADPDAVAPRTIAIPPSLPKKSALDAKLNLLKLLREHKSATKPDVFKPIGDRIVVPVKLCLSTKKPSNTPANSATACDRSVSSTFTMAVPAGKVGPKLTFVNPTIVRKAPFVARRIESTSIPRPVAVRLPPCPPEKDAGEYGDLNKFMSTVSSNLCLPGQGDLDPKPSIVFPPKLDAKLCEPDDELTSLSWLSSDNKELYNEIKKLNPDDPGIGMSGDETDSEEGSDNKSIFTASSKVGKQNNSRNGNPNSTEYNPLGKPPYSFSCLIFMAIEDSPLKMLPVKEIYSWVCKHFPYFRTAPQGWKNSIRHNLSLNRCFKKAETAEAPKDTVKGSLWCIDPAYRPNLVQALKRSPSYPYLHPSGLGQPLTLCNLGNLLHGVNAGYVPSWSPHYYSSSATSGLWADPDMASAALNLMGLRAGDSSPKQTDSIVNTIKELQEEISRFHGPAWTQDGGNRTRSDSAESVGTEQLVIRDSSEDHNYAGSGSSVGESPFVDLKTLKGESGERCVTPDSEKSAPDAAYEFETGWITSDEEGEGARAIEEIMADEQEQEEEEEDEEDKDLFDSGFGCMRRRRGRKGRPQKRRRSHCETGIGPKRVKPDTRIAKRKTRKAPILERSTKRESSSAQNSRLRVRISARSKKRPVSPKNKRKPVSKRERKLSDADSGKDSPKVVRARRRRVATSAPIKMHKIEKKRSSPPTTTSHHRTTRQSASFTRSRAIYSSRSTGTMLGRKDKKKRQKRARLASNSRDDEEEIKLAAGSLMRLAGLITSPIAPSRAATS